MAKIQMSVTIDRPVKEVWRFMTDFSGAKIKDPNVKGRYTSSGERRVNASTELVYPEQKLSLRVLEYEENRKIALEFTSGPIRGSRTTFTFETVDGKTKVTRSDDVRAVGFYRLFGFMITRTVMKTMTDDLMNTKRAMESEQGPQTPKKEG
jgi:carbon monoxide dehydrogenase subunit G